MENNFQRVGAISNSQVGRDFEEVALRYFQGLGINLIQNYAVPVGVDGRRKGHLLDLGSSEPPILVECKSHRWTAGENVPSAKITVWNEAMYYFHLAPSGFRKVLFVLRDFSRKRGLSLGSYYVRSYNHLIPGDVEILEYDQATGVVTGIA